MDYGNFFCVVFPKYKLYWLRSWMSQINDIHCVITTIAINLLRPAEK